MDMTFWHYVALEAVKAIITLLALAFVGQRVIAYWDIRKKRVELDIAAANQFHQLYGEFKTVWRLWKIFNDNEGVQFPEHSRAELLKRATSAESGIEAITVKLASERALNEAEIKTLGLFRQAYQLVREAIRYNKPLNWQWDSLEYRLFNALSSEVSRMISSNEKRQQPTLRDAQENFRKITDIRREAWEEEINRMKGPKARGAA
jgi:hypothetical protein